MERQREQDEASDYQQRCNEHIALQKAFIFEEFIPRCEKIGMNKQHAAQLIRQFFLDIGDLYRKTQISPDHFRKSLVKIAEDLITHADEHKYFLSESGADVGWDATIKAIGAVNIPPQLQIDKEEQVAYHDVYFPVVKPTDIKGNGTEGRRIRTVIHLDSTEKEHLVEAINLSGLAERLRARMEAVFQH